MPKKKDFDVFISHVSSDAELAMALKQCIEDDFTSLLVFASSDNRSIGAGGWMEQIRAALKDSKVVIVLCSPESIRRPWIAFEAGAAWLRKGVSLVLLCHSGMRPSELGPPFDHLQAKGIDLAGLRWVYDEISSQFAQVKRAPEPRRVNEAVLRLESAAGKIMRLRNLREVVNCVMALSYRNIDGARQFLLVRTTAGSKWTFPKGRIQTGSEMSDVLEHLRAELLEEAGASGLVVGSHFGPFTYVKDSGERRQVLAFPVRVEVDGGPVENGRQPKWCSLDLARGLLSEGRDLESAKGLVSALDYLARIEDLT